MAVFQPFAFRASLAEEVFLLDDYPGASLAYSLRKLSSTYTGNCIRVVRSSDSTEADIDFAADGYVNQTAIEAFRAGSSFVYVKTWYDQSGNGNDLTQASTSKQAYFYNSGYFVEGGKYAIRFDNSQLENNTAIGVANDTSYFMVNAAVTNPSSQDGGIIQTQEDLGGGSFAVNSIGFRDGGYFVRLNKTGTANVSLNGYDFSTTNQHLAATVIDYSATSNQFLYNNINQTDVNTARSNTGAGSTVSVGRTSDPNTGLFTFINLQELIMYSSNQTSNISGISTNINDYFSLY